MENGSWAGAHKPNKGRYYSTTDSSGSGGLYPSIYQNDHSSSKAPPPPYDQRHSRNSLTDSNHSNIEHIDYQPTYTDSTPDQQSISSREGDRHRTSPEPLSSPKSTLERVSTILPYTYSEQPTLRRTSYPNPISISDSLDMVVASIYKIGFWILTALLIIVGAVIIGLLGAGKLTFGATDKYSVKRGSRFFLLTFNDVSKESFDASAVGRTGLEYLKKMEHYISDVEGALRTKRSLPELYRVDILNIEKSQGQEGVGISALLAFDGTATNDSLNVEILQNSFNETRNASNSNWRDVIVTEMLGLTLPTPTTAGPVITDHTTKGQPPTTPVPIVPVGGRCIDELIGYCSDTVNYTKVYYPNPLAHKGSSEAKAATGLFQILQHNKCHPTIKDFACFFLQPQCSAKGDAILPCATYCNDVLSTCQSFLNGTYLENATEICNGLPMSNCNQICLAEHFTCEISGLCLPKSSRCNNRFECGPSDYSDEKGCGCKDPNQGQCPSGQCIPKFKFCNNINDCGDWGDEINCSMHCNILPRGKMQAYIFSSACAEGYKKCDTTGQCFPERFWCNDVFDCADKSDEKNCTCTVSDFKCQNGYCLHPEVRCNGENDCDDFSDEFNCECEEYQFKCDKYLCKNYINHWCNRRPDCDDKTDEPANCTCKEYQFRCDNGQCIPIYEKCDGKPQCDDNSDEMHCACTKHEFKCSDGQCIPMRAVCDGKFQCKGGEDERQNCTCQKGTFPCNDGRCTHIDYWCNNSTDCPNGEDEPPNCHELSLCPPGYPLNCTSRKTGKSLCVHQQQVCNGHVLCKDGEDEQNCDCSPESKFTCPSGTNETRICLPWSKYCNGQTDCPFADEEANCKCNEEHQFACTPDDKKISKCIGLRSKCNGIPECFDGSDEAGCTCGDVLRNRDPHKLCDGIPDCPDFTDEFHEDCNSCNSTTHYSCNDAIDCIPLNAVCDGVKHCPSGDDEKFCYKLAETEDELSKFWETTPNGILYGRRGGKWAPACAVQSLAEKASMEAMCAKLGFERMQKFERVALENVTDYVNIAMNSESDLAILPKFAECPAQEAIRLTCDMNSIKCGQRPLIQDTPSARIIGGKISKFGTWPFYAALYENGRLHCGSTIIDQNWVLTAAHCIFERSDGVEVDTASKNAKANASEESEVVHKRTRRHVVNIAGNWEGYRVKSLDTLIIRAGMIRNSSRSPYDQFRRIDAIIPHSMFNPKNGRNDMALIRLHSPLTYSAYVMPSCMANRTASNIAIGSDGQSNKCTAVGYGSLGRERDPMSDELMEVQLPARDSNACKRIPTINVDLKIDSTQICAGTADGGRDTCQGDSGGPLQCQICHNGQGSRATCSWWTIGVTSQGYTCGAPMTPGIYMKVSEYDDWINAVITKFNDVSHNHTCAREGKYSCLLGNCIAEDKVCNRFWDCAFGEDEEKCH